MNKKRRNWIFCVVVGVLCVVLALLPTEVGGNGTKAIPRVTVRVLSINNDDLAPLGIVYSGVQHCGIVILDGEYKGIEAAAVNYLNSALDKDKLFAVGDKALAMLYERDGEVLSLTLIDHYRLNMQGVLFALFGILLAVFGGIILTPN